MILSTVTDQPYVKIVLPMDLETARVLGVEAARRYISRSAFARMALAEALDADAVAALPGRLTKRRRGSFPTALQFVVSETLARRLDFKVGCLGMARVHYVDAALRLALAKSSQPSTDESAAA